MCKNVHYSQKVSDQNETHRKIFQALSLPERPVLAQCTRVFVIYCRIRNTIEIRIWFPKEYIMTFISSNASDQYEVRTL